MKKEKNYLTIHRFFVFLLLCITIILSYFIFNLLKSKISIETILSTGAIVATFGSAMSAIGSLFEKDLTKRVFLNIDILYRDILKDEEPWRRWPFLKRKDKSLLLNKNKLQSSLKNPKIPLDVGTHKIEVELPTVQEDFFDLGLFKNYFNLFRYRRAAKTYYFRKKEEKKENETDGFDYLMEYECLFDIWKSIYLFRISRYILIIGVGFIFSSIMNTVYFI